LHVEPPQGALQIHLLSTQEPVGFEEEVEFVAVQSEFLVQVSEAFKNGCPAPDECARTRRRKSLMFILLYAQLY
jgi:hypothetical protein